MKPQLSTELYDVKCEQLEVGDILYQYDNDDIQEIELKSITEKDMGEVQTYIIKVEHNHNFFANDILVHNK